MDSGVSNCFIDITSMKKLESTPRAADSTNYLPQCSIRNLPVRHLRGFDLALFRLRLRLRHRTFSSSAFQLNNRQLVKHGNRVRLTEAITMDFIARNTTIPVPRVLEVFVVRGSMHIVQEYIDAPVLEDVWTRMSLEEKESCMIQLKGYVDQLRGLVPPEPARVQAVDGTGCIDDRLYPGVWGPFDNIDEFNAFFFHDIVRQRPHHYPDAQGPLAKTHGRTWRIVFAHGDLGPHNILWKDGRIAGIIDWECAGWFPEYWEYTRAYFTSAYSLPSWWEMFIRSMDQYPAELEVERCLSAYFVRI